MSESLMSQAAKATHVYVGRPRCGCAVAVCVDDKHAARDVKEFMSRGYAVTRMTYEEYRATVKLGHVCYPLSAAVEGASAPIPSAGGAGGEVPASPS